MFSVFCFRYDLFLDSLRHVAISFQKPTSNWAELTTTSFLKLSRGKNRWIAGGTTLVVGYDVTHPGKPSRDEVMNHMPPEKPSIVGVSWLSEFFLSSYAARLGIFQWRSPSRIVYRRLSFPDSASGKSELQVDGALLNARFKWMLDLFIKNRGVWPERIIITRDGGQYRMVGNTFGVWTVCDGNVWFKVVEDELGAIKEACEEFGNLHGRESWIPPFTVIVATKRHHARFFKEHHGVVDNPLPATVVDTDVVRNDITEFFMQSHRPV
ncbi:unnamed protein product, partial [Cylicostephanus goldi]